MLPAASPRQATFVSPCRLRLTAILVRAFDKARRFGRFVESVSQIKVSVAPKLLQESPAFPLTVGAGVQLSSAKMAGSIVPHRRDHRQHRAAK
jgi:hypothetical protein